MSDANYRAQVFLASQLQNQGRAKSTAMDISVLVLPADKHPNRNKRHPVIHAGERLFLKAGLPVKQSPRKVSSLSLPLQSF